jgi:uncharacterized membrane protein
MSYDSKHYFVILVMDLLWNQVSWQRCLFAITVSTLISVRGLKKKSLSLDGAVTAFITGLIHCFAGYDFTFVLAIFFYSSSFWTKYKSDIKHKIEADFKEGTSKTRFERGTAFDMFF